MDGMPIDWLLEMPPVTRMWFLGIIAVSIGEQFHFVSDFQLVYSFTQAVGHREYWRFVTCFLYFGRLNLNLVYNTFFLIHYSQILEESFAMQAPPFPDNEDQDNPDGRVRYHPTGITNFINKHAATLEYLWMLLLVSVSLLAVTSYFKLLGFLGPMLSNILIYIWARRNPDVNLSFLGVIVFTAPYLPWFMLLFSVIMGSNGTLSGNDLSQPFPELIPIVIGHAYFFLEDIYPRLHNGRRLLAPPWYWVARSLTSTVEAEAQAQAQAQNRQPGENQLGQVPAGPVPTAQGDHEPIRIGSEKLFKQASSTEENGHLKEAIQVKEKIEASGSQIGSDQQVRERKLGEIQNEES